MKLKDLLYPTSEVEKADESPVRPVVKPTPRAAVSRPPDSAGKPQAVRIFSEVVGELIWLVLSPEGMAYVQPGEVCYTPEEIKNLRDATEEEVKAVHQVKKSIGGRLIQVKEREGLTA
ncbi:MAG: hypothetical protein HZA19_06925 [Nitrospirae bacterium]|nr:hypothetical protein [Nitrospirota bacterium]